MNINEAEAKLELERLDTFFKLQAFLSKDIDVIGAPIDFSRICIIDMRKYHWECGSIVRLFLSSGNSMREQSNIKVDSEYITPIIYSEFISHIKFSVAVHKVKNIHVLHILDNAKELKE